MAPRTLSSTWKQLERLFKRFNDGTTTEEQHFDAVEQLCVKANASGIVGALATLFVRRYPGLEEATVAFATRSDGRFPDWITSYAPEDDVVRVNPVGVFGFVRRCRDAIETTNTPEGRETFLTYRFTAYLAELSKLPSVYLLFIQLLKEVARVAKIVRVEKKGGEVEEVEDEDYMILLWAFKELEALLYDSNGSSIRAEHAVRWYDSDWMTGK